MTALGKVRVAWLEAFVATADAENQAAAASDLKRDQGTVSRQLGDLEIALGSKLFLKGSTKLLPAGVKFKPVAERVLKELYDARTAIVPVSEKADPSVSTRHLKVPGAKEASRDE